jgi:peptidoglycan/xylan/chitin deacetylase (PgdA/CDA1 family)
MASAPFLQPADAAELAFRPGPRRLRFTPLHWGVGAVHVGAAAAVVASPATWPWALAAAAASHAVVVAQTFFPRAQYLGPALVRLPRGFAERGAVALTFDDGPDPDVTPRTLDLLDAAEAKATFFCIGERVRRFPALAREIVTRGHAVENHSYAHSPYGGFWAPGRVRRDILAAQDAIADATGKAPLFFRPPFGVRNPILEAALAATGLHCVIWTCRPFDTITRDVDRVLARLTAALGAGAIFVLHDGIAIRSRKGTPMVLQALPGLLAALAQRNLQSINLRALAQPA